jgi:uncharacterized repeat protein (TIGR01451 family)
LRTPSTLEFLRYSPASEAAEEVTVSATEFSSSRTPSGPFSPLDPPVSALGMPPLDLSRPLPLVPSELFHLGDAVFVRLTDSDQNRDPGRSESVVVTITASTGDTEMLRLQETGTDTGVFTGFIQSVESKAGSGNGWLTVGEESTIRGSYTDIADQGDTSASAGLFDPLGTVFDSRTGLPVNGAIVTLMRVIAPGVEEEASVFGDDGVSPYPASIVSGTSAMDGSGKNYIFLPGRFRFPLVAPGNYRLQVDPPVGYAYPTAVSTPDLQDLPAGPFAIVEPGSRDEIFTINPGPVLHIDLPVDPAAGSGLWVIKSAGKDVVGIGDFLPYTIAVENHNRAGSALGSIVTDRLPPGFRYQKGSTRIDGLAAPDPAIGSDGQTLTFSTGDVPAGETRRINYVVEVAAGTKAGDAVNTAVAVTRNGVSSNIAVASVTVREDFFRNAAFIVGEVVAGVCGEADGTATGVPGARIYLEDGTYVITDENGMYHFEGTPPGVHVVQLDLDSLPEWYEVVPCEENSRFAGNEFSQFVDLQGGTLWRADFHLALKPQARGDVSLELNSSLHEDQVVFRLPMQVNGVPLRNLRLSVTLPEGVEFVAGSSLLSGAALPDPKATGGILEFTLGDWVAGRAEELSFRANIDRAGKTGELPAFAVLTFDTPAATDQTTPPAENRLQRSENEKRVALPAFVLQTHFPSFGAVLANEDRKMIDSLDAQLKGLTILHTTAVGHTDSDRVAARSRHIYADNFALSDARAHTVLKYLGETLELSADKTTLVGKGATVPVADNATEEGKALNRRVEVRVEVEGTEKTRQVDLIQPQSGTKTTETSGLRPGETWEDKASREPDPAGTDKGSDPDGILYPLDGSKLANRVAGVRVLLPANLKPRLALDGKEISADRIGFKMEDKKSGKTLYSYIGIDFGDKGKHVLHLQGLDPFGNPRFEQQAEIVRTGEIAFIRIVESDGNVADGKTPLTMRLQLLDVNGQVINASAKLKILDGNLRPESKNEETAEPAEDSDSVEVDAQGYVRFQPTQASGLYHATLGYNDRTVKVETYARPELRDWILVGLGDGTVGYNTLSSHMETPDSDIDENLYEDGRVAFFAKGQIQGKWLLTLAYDSDKPDREGKSLFQTINPSSYYTLYGDGTAQGYEAASAEKLYLKIEREQFYALFGDFETGLTVTELSRYSRSLTGLKSELNTRNFSFNLFASDTNQAFVKDEIRGDGTSGLYRLSRKSIVLNSEKITVEIRDRFRSEIILSAVPLSRYIDYEIDYDAGTLLFKEPIPSQDQNFNPVYIVVDFESNDTEDKSYTYGGRAAARGLDGKVEVGATTVHEGQTGGDGDLYGLDATWNITPATELRAEAATSDAIIEGSRKEGSAWLTELTHRSLNNEGKVYYREQEEGFGLGQQNVSESGTRKMGLEATSRLNEQWSLRGQAYRQYNLEEDNRRDVIEGITTFDRKNYSLNFGLRQATDRLDDGRTNQSNQVTLGGAWRTLGDRLNLRVQHDQSLNGRGENSDFPTRTVFGADYKLTRAVTLFADQEFTWGEDRDTQSTRVGMKTTPWQGGEINSSVAQEINENQARVFANLGLKQTLRINKNLSLDGSIDRSHTLKHPGTEPFDKDVPFASGSSDDFTAVSLGANYQEEKWSWDNRVEYRTADSENKWGFLSGIIGEVREGLGLSARVQVFLTDADSGREATDGSVRLGLAYRPFQSRWIVLDRLDYLFEKESGEEFNYNNWRLVNNLNANYKPNSKTQVSLQYGAKYVQENIEGQSYSGYTDLIGVEGRYDLTRRWDVGLRTSVLHSWNSDTLDYSAGASVGCNVVKNAWVSLGYNVVGFEDEDFSRSAFTAQGPFMQFRFKFDQNSVRDLLKQI